MLESWVNDAAMVFAGIILGALASLATLLDPRPQLAELPRGPGEGFLDWQRRVQREQQARLADAPRSYTLASVALGGFVLVLVVSILASPLEMRWWYFLGGFAFAMLAFASVRMLAREGKLPIPEGSPLLRALRNAAARDSERPPKATA
jgi:hypothetical protein